MIYRGRGREREGKREREQPGIDNESLQWVTRYQAEWRSNVKHITDVHVIVQNFCNTCFVFYRKCSVNNLRASYRLTLSTCALIAIFLQEKCIWELKNRKWWYFRYLFSFVLLSKKSVNCWIFHRLIWQMYICSEDFLISEVSAASFFRETLWHMMMSLCPVICACN